MEKVEARVAVSEARAVGIYPHECLVHTQPIEEPEPRTQLAEVFDWMGWDRILFATDYPHWDYDDPARALPIR